MKKTMLLGAALALALITFTSADAREFREMRQIKTPMNVEELQKGAEGTTPVTQPVKIDDALIRAAIESLFNRWATSDVERYVADKFPNRGQLLNAFSTHVPMDARLEIRGIRAVRVLSQHSKEDNLVSIVSAEVETDVRYQDPTLGLQRLRGTGEYVFELVTKAI